MRKYLGIVFLCLFFADTGFSQKATLLFPPDSSCYSPYFISKDKIWVTQMIDGKENILQYERKNNEWGDRKLINSNMAVGGWVDSVIYYYNSRMDIYSSDSQYPYFTLIQDELYVTGGGDRIIVIADYNGFGSIQPYMLLREKGKWSRPRPINELLDKDGSFYSPFWKEDTLFFSKNKLGGKYEIFYSAYNSEKNKFEAPVKMPKPYNDSISNNVFYSQQNGSESFCSDRYGKIQIFVTELNKEDSRKKTLDQIDEKDSIIFQRVPYTFKMVLDTTIGDDRYMISLRGGDIYNASISSKGYSYYNTTVSLKKHGATIEELLEFFDEISGMIDPSKIYAQLGVFKTDKFNHFRWLLPKYSQNISREKSFAVKGAYKYKIDAASIEDVVEICDYAIEAFTQKKVNDEPFIYVGVLGGGFRIYRKTGDLYDIVYESLPNK